MKMNVEFFLEDGRWYWKTEGQFAGYGPFENIEDAQDDYEACPTVR